MEKFFARIENRMEETNRPTNDRKKTCKVRKVITKGNVIGLRKHPTFCRFANSFLAVYIKGVGVRFVNHK